MTPEARRGVQQAEHCVCREVQGTRLRTSRHFDSRAWIRHHFDSRLWTTRAPSMIDL